MRASSLFYLSKLKSTIMVMVCLALFSSMAMAQEKVPIDSPDYWCGATWPPKEGKDRTRGIDVNGDVCIKIQRIVETTVEVVEVVEVEVEKIVEVEKKSGDIRVTLLQDDKGNPVMTASCPGEYSWYKLRATAIENGCVEKMRTKSGMTRVMFEDCKRE